VTEAAMRGEIDFRESLTRRVRLLAGLPESALERVYAERLRLNPGAEQLIAGLQRAGVRTVLVSGGFTYFTERLRERLGFDHAYANQLEVRDGRLTGQVAGEIVDGQAKRSHLETLRDRYCVEPGAVMAVGDGANDLPMFRAAGISIAYHAKPVVRSQASYMLNHVGLEGILNLFA
ncbi:MAG: phosphoserine phosphatase SerB, partial [Zoogloea sp.]|nr:phosphoserine phosphatase SerB [Zoogloea sp.]